MTDAVTPSVKNWIVPIPILLVPAVNVSPFPRSLIPDANASPSRIERTVASCRFTTLTPELYALPSVLYVPFIAFKAFLIMTVLTPAETPLGPL